MGIHGQFNIIMGKKWFIILGSSSLPSLINYHNNVNIGRNLFIGFDKEEE